ncbi:Protein kinase domain-containing protein [Psidium guajava]|nr:Protein kinase domain-containing protein [Psidium guajava]
MLPGLKSRISTALVSVAKEHASYGEIIESKAGQGALLLNILSKYYDGNVYLLFDVATYSFQFAGLAS